MDVLKNLAVKIAEMTGEKVEIEPSISDIKTDKFVISCDSLWKEPEGLADSGDNSYTQDGKKLDTYCMMLPIRVVFTSKGTGEKWRSEMLRKTQEIAKRFHPNFNMFQLGGKLEGEAARRVEAVVADFEELNTDDSLALGYSIELNRDGDSDIAFERQENEGQSDYFLMEMVYTGIIFFNDSQEVL